ncbi:importin subunit alpha-2 [Tanacetum coccineum]
MSLRPNARTEVRCNRYKVAVDAEESRRRREDNMVKICKNKQEEDRCVVVWKSVGYGVSKYWIRRIGDFFEHGYTVYSLMDMAYWSSE